MPPPTLSRPDPHYGINADVHPTGPSGLVRKDRVEAIENQTSNEETRTVGVEHNFARSTYWVERVSSLLFFLAIWQGISTFFLEDFILPPPLEVGREIVSIVETGELWEHALFSYQRLFIAFALTLVMGSAIGLAMGMSRWLDGFFRDASVIMFTTPSLIFVLVAGLIFGISYVGPIVAIVVASFSYVSFNLWEGVRSVPKDLMDMGQVYKMRRVARIRHIVMPAVAPYGFQGARFGFAMTWKVALLAEVFGGNSGLGYKMGVAYQSFDVTSLLAWVLSFVLSALFFERLLLQQLENRSLRWRPDVGGG